ncbi:MAG: hypothetical protein A4E37_01107 [Methanoregulaceae archaeon PtaB.Bin056]|jgi:hypothetical protein|nr:MAG: hypothetical protein A4E37_01107 [Methanoregulaceae archaeon PtaB.Bin056]
MDPKTINSLILVVGFFLLLTGIMQVMAAPGIIDYFSIVFGLILIGTALIGFRKGKVV